MTGYARATEPPNGSTVAFHVIGLLDPNIARIVGGRSVTRSSFGERLGSRRERASREFVRMVHPALQALHLVEQTEERENLPPPFSCCSALPRARRRGQGGKHSAAREDIASRRSTVIACWPPIAEPRGAPLRPPRPLRSEPEMKLLGHDRLHSFTAGIPANSSNG